MRLAWMKTRSGPSSFSLASCSTSVAWPRLPTRCNTMGRPFWRPIAQ
ncbi:hypothetical protein ACN28S_49835 [Cystobacter fuscus]